MLARRIALFTLALGMVVVFAIPGQTASRGGRIRATIDWSEVGVAQTFSVYDQVTFVVTAEGTKPGDDLWVANKCDGEGGIHSEEYRPVEDSGLAGPFTLGHAPLDGGPQGSWQGGPATCTAFVWLFPSSNSPLRGASLTFSAGG